MGCPPLVTVSVPPELAGLRQRVQALDKDLAKANKVRWESCCEP